MSEVKENVDVEEQREWKADGSEWIWAFLVAMLFGGFGIFEDTNMSKLEKKTVGIDGQIPMIGGKKFE